MESEDIINLQAGRELDALVAEKIMEWYKIRLMNSQGKADYRGFPQGIYSITKVRRYSTDLKNAWEVVEKMHELDWKCTHTFFSPSARMIGHHAEYWKGSGGWMKSKSATAETFPLAVCKAALLALFEKEE